MNGTDQKMSEPCPMCGEDCLVVVDENGNMKHQSVAPVLFKAHARKFDKLYKQIDFQAKRIEVLEQEKQRRIYYQDIVYSVCNTLDVLLSLRIVCGTLNGPTTECQDATTVAASELTRLREVMEPLEVFRTAVIGWRANDWPEGFDRRTAELVAEMGRLRVAQAAAKGEGDG